MEIHPILYWGLIIFGSLSGGVCIKTFVIDAIKSRRRIRDKKMQESLDEICRCTKESMHLLDDILQLLKNR